MTLTQNDPQLLSERPNVPFVLRSETSAATGAMLVQRKSLYGVGVDLTSHRLDGPSRIQPEFLAEINKALGRINAAGVTGYELVHLSGFFRSCTGECPYLTSSEPRFRYHARRRKNTVSINCCSGVLSLWSRGQTMTLTRVREASAI